MNHSSKLYKYLSKEIKSDNSCYCKVARALTKWGAIIFSLTLHTTQMYISISNFCTNAYTVNKVNLAIFPKNINAVKKFLDVYLRNLVRIELNFIIQC